MRGIIGLIVKGKNLYKPTELMKISSNFYQPKCTLFSVLYEKKKLWPFTFSLSAVFTSRFCVLYVFA